MCTGCFLVRKASLCLAAESYKPCCSFGTGPSSQELEDRACLRPQAGSTINLQPSSAGTSSGSLQSHLNTTTTSFPSLTLPRTGWWARVPHQRGVSEFWAGLLPWTPKLPGVSGDGWAGLTYRASLLPIHRPPGLCACEESHERDTLTIWIHAVKLFCICLQTPVSHLGLMDIFWIEKDGLSHCCFALWNNRNLPLKLPLLGYRNKYFINKIRKQVGNKYKLLLIPF